MKRAIAFIAFALAIAPSLSFADSAIPSGPTPAQLIARVAAIEALEAAADATTSVSCAALFSAPAVTVGQTVELGWGSVGAMAPGASSTQSMWPQNGASTLSFQKPGTWTYGFTFYGIQGGTANCAATIKVIS